MMKRFLIIAAVIGLLVSCPDPADKSSDNNSGNSGKPNNPNNPQQNTTIVFDNTQGICTVVIYDNYQRREQDKIAEVPAGRLSDEIEYTPGTSVPFYFLYRVNLKGINGFTLDYVPKEIGKDQTSVRIDANKKTTVSIHKLDETLSSPDTLLSDKSYLIIQNNSTFSFQLHRGSSILPPDNLSASTVNSGERALYTINPGAVSPYQLLVGADYKTFSNSIVTFEAGRVYSFIFDGNVSLITETEIILENVAGSSSNSSTPETPGAPTVTALDSLLTLRWIAVERAENYEVYYSTAQQPPSMPAKTVAGTTATLQNLSNKTAYYVWIKAVNNSGSSDFSPVVRGIPWSNNQAPAVPGTPVIIPGINQLTVNWEECGGAASYEVYINTTATKPSAPDVSTEKTSAVINNLVNNQIYYIWVRAVNSTGKSDYSPMESGTPKIPTAIPAVPLKPVLTAGNRKLTVSWQAVELAAAYEVWLGTTDNSAQAKKQGGDITGSATETVITGLLNETIYYVWIKAKNVVGTSGFSLPANAKPSAFAVLPETPAVPTVTAGNRELSINWQSVEGALSYEVWTGTTNNSTNAQKNGADVSGTSVTLTGLINDTTYYIWIKAKNNIGVSDLSLRASGTPSAFAATPSAPQNAPTIIAGSGQLSVSWSAAEGANSYEVWAGTDTNPTLATKRGGDVTGLSSVITGLTNGTTYYVWIKAKNSVGTSNFSPMATGMPSVFSITPQTPAAPSVSVGNGQITVTWTAVEGATAYEVWTGTSNSSASASKNGADVSADLSVTINGLANGTTYYVWIKAKNNVGASGFSPAASGKPIANAAVPTLSAGNGQISVTWAAIAGADQYDIFCGTGINPPESATQTVTSTSATISGLTNSTTYNVWVRGKNSTGTGVMSGAASAKPIGNMGTVTLTTGGSGELVLSWSAVAGADEYDVFRNTSNTIPANSTLTVSTTTATFTGLTNGTTYYVWIKPKNANGAGAVSTSVNGVPMAVPGNITVSVGNQQVAISWTAVTGASSYEVYYSTTTTIPSAASFTGTGTSRTITGLTNGTTYYFWIKAVNSKGTSAASPMASGKPIGNMGTVTLNTGGSGELVLSWSEVAGADEYDVYRNTTNTIPTSSTLTVSTTTTTITGLTNGTTYYVWVKGKNANGTGAASTSVNGKPLGTPETPTIITGINQLQVTWTAVTGAAEYELYYGIGVPATLMVTTTGITTTITGLINNRTYYICLRAKNTTGVSDYSPIASGIPGRAPGLYRGTEKIGTQNLAASLTYISTNVVSGDDFYIILGADESVSPKTLSYSGKTVGITLMGYGVERTIDLNSNGSLFTINSGVTLTLDENITLVGMSTNNNSLVYLNNNSKLIMNNGAKITGNKSGFERGGGVYVSSGGTFTMNGGQILNNICRAGTAMGGGIFVYGTFIMNDGLISGNQVETFQTYSYGGGVCVGSNNPGSSGSFVMNGGEISNNTVGGPSDYYGLGGGVAVLIDSSFSMHGGIIASNKALSDYFDGISARGGGIYIWSSSGRFIKSSLADSNSSGIIYGYTEGDSRSNYVTTTSGVIANGQGHAVYVSSSPVKRRETTAGPGVNLDSNVSGSAGGWE